MKDNNITYATFGPTRTVAILPSQYRLAKDPWGNLVLQGGYYWSQGEEEGIEWKSLPTVELT